MLMTRASRLAVEALVMLSDPGSQERLTAETLSRRTIGDLASLQQVLGRLGRAGIIRSRQGRNGGYQLARAPRSMTLRDVVQAIDGQDVQRCLMDSTICDGWRSCRLAPTWHPIREQLMRFLDTETIESIAQRSRGTAERFALSDMDELQG